MAEPLRYPLKKIEKSDDYLQIDIVKYTPPGFSQEEGSLALSSSDETYGYFQKNPDSREGILETILLPIPENINDSNLADWGDSSMGPIEALASSSAVDLIKNPSLGNLTKIASKKAETIVKALETGVAQKGFQYGFAGAAINALFQDGEKGQKYLERGAGITFNQNVEMLFNGVKLRPGFGFIFDMVPRSQKEKEQIQKIIRSFKKYSAVGKGADYGAAKGLFLKAPQVFRIRYMSGGKAHPFLNKFKICALTNMTVNYTGSGTYATYVDGTPVHMVLTLNFQELTPIYYEDYLNTEEGGSDDGIGVGY